MLFTHQFCLCVSVWQRASTTYSLRCRLQLWSHLRRSWESTASMGHHRDNYPALGIRLNSLLLQLHIITNPKSCIRSPSRQLLLLSIPVELQIQQIEPDNWSRLSCRHPNDSDQICYIKTANQSVHVGCSYYIAHVNITCETESKWISEMNHSNLE